MPSGHRFSEDYVLVRWLIVPRKTAWFRKLNRFTSSWILRQCLPPTPHIGTASLLK